MKGNRRNYYRVLHVQPEAPPEIVTASYRTMMSKLRLHPDLGGDHETATLVNQAYAVLNDPERRRQYDLSLRQDGMGSHPRTRRTAPDKAAAPARAADPVRGPATQRPAQRSTLRADRVCCQYCQSGLPAEIQPDTRCPRCDSPVAPPPAGPAAKYELFGRRSDPRVSKTDAVTLYQGWPARTCGGRLRDLSLTGIGVVTEAAIPVGRVLRIVGPSFDVLACVISCHPGGRFHVLHARLLTVIFARQTGVFVSTKS